MFQQISAQQVGLMSTNHSSERGTLWTHFCLELGKYISEYLKATVHHWLFISKYLNIIHLENAVGAVGFQESQRTPVLTNQQFMK